MQSPPIRDAVPGHGEHTVASVLSIAMVLAMVAAAPAADGPAAPGRRKPRPPLEVGTPAPDFELPLLKEDWNEQGEKIGRITDRKIKLSSFRGKKVVCLFMSSYT